MPADVQTHVVIEPRNKADGGYLFKKVHETVVGNREEIDVDAIESSTLTPWDFTLNAKSKDEVYFYVTDTDESGFLHKTFTITMKTGQAQDVFQVSNRPLPSGASTVKADGTATPANSQWGTPLDPGFQSVVYTGPDHPSPGYTCLRLAAVSGGKSKDNGGPTQHQFTVAVAGYDPHDPDIGFEC